MAAVIQPTQVFAWCGEFDPEEEWPRSLGGALADQILAGRITRLQPALSNGTLDQHAAHLTNIFPRLVEQSITRMSPKALTNFIAGTSKAELSELARLYLADLRAQSRTGLLLPIVALRSNGISLNRWASAFGTMPVYEALARYAPQKLPSFEIANAARPVAEPRGEPFSPNIDMTLRRIYQGFRLAPIGATSIPAALYQTAAYAGAHLVATATVAYNISSYTLLPLVQNYAPQLYEDIGGTMHQILENLSGLFSMSMSEAQEAATYDFHVTDYSTQFAETGGDYGVVEAWQVAAGYGGWCRTKATK
jgi:hypothetical protein